jgi:uncharacterized protein YfaS (alpha-2-macroglobulin family)
MWVRIGWAVLLSVGVSIGVSTGALAAPAPLEILRITPVGMDVPPGQQIVIEFDRPVVPLGRMARDSAEIPVTIEPELDCQWRWVNRQALACQLSGDAQMAWATRYSVSVAPGFEALDGSAMTAAVSAEFVTRRPDVNYVNIERWDHPGLPVLRIRFNQPVYRTSVAESVRIAVENETSAVVLDVQADPEEVRREAEQRRQTEEWAVPAGDRLTPGFQPDEGARRTWIVAPTEPLALDRLITVHLDAGLRSPLGGEPGPAHPDIIGFHTFPEFSFVGVQCLSSIGQQILLRPEDPVSTEPARMCNPLSWVSLQFSAPVFPSVAKGAIIVEPDLAGGREDYDPWANVRDYRRIAFRHGRGATYGVSLPERLRAFEAYRVANRGQGLVDALLTWFDSEQTSLTDVFGRSLTEDFDLSFWTNHRNPDFTLVHRDAVLEAAIDSEVPLYVTNLDEVRLNYRRLGEDGPSETDTRRIEVPDVDDISFAIPLGVRGMLDGGSGVVHGAIDTDPPVARGPYQRRFFAQVTPYQVHAKVGHFNTLVWVTDLETGAAVADATVSIYRDLLSTLKDVPADGVRATTDDQGIALLPGTETLDPELETFSWNCGEDCEKLVVRVDGGRGMALLPLNNAFRANVGRASNYKVWVNKRVQYGHIHAWGTTAQGVYRAGDTIQFKIYLRDQTNETFVAAPAGTYKLALTDPTGKTVHEVQDLTLDAFGALHGEYQVPQTSVMGWYQFSVSADFTDLTWWPMQVLVSDFTPAAFRVSADLNGDLFRPGDELVTDTRAALHSGGPYTQAEARVSVNLSARGFRSSDPVASRFQFDTSNQQSRMQLHQEIGELTSEGGHESRLTLTETGIVYGILAVESAVRDDRGKYVAASASAGYVALDRFVGLKKDRWIFDEDQPAEVRYLVVDERGEPVNDTAVSLQVERLETKAARVKSAGNAYTTSYTESWEAAGSCTGTPGSESLICTFTPEQPGRYRVVASIEDTHGRAHSTTLMLWVAGKGRVVWRDDSGHALELIPEATNYEVGDTVRVLVKNPYPGATALVSVERYGVLRQWQTTLEGSTPVIEFPVEADDVPGAYLSVVVFSPRVADPPAANADGDQTVDLGKPAFRVGYLALPVADPHKRLDVTATVDREVYRPGERVQVSLGAVPAHPDDEVRPVSYAVVVLDEAVLDLIAGGRDYFDPYAGFYSLDGLDVDNYSLLLRIVGRQKFEKKGANAGGDGGDGLSMRTVFRYVAHWNPSLEADPDGNAEFEFELPDNLTGWRVLALAVTPTDRFGLGDAQFRTNQPTEIRPVMPNQVSEGDGFRAGFAVMNRTDRQRTLSVTIVATGDVDAGRAELTRELTLEPFKRETVYLPVVAGRLPGTRDLAEGTIRFEARAADDTDGDGLTHSIPVLKQRSLEVAASYGAITGAGTTEPVVLPPEVYRDVGGLSVVASPTVIGNLEGAFRYLRDYPYTCWEQKLTRGVMASHFSALQPRLEPTLAWPEAAQLPADMLAQAANYQAPNGGMVYYVPQDQNVSPYLSAYTALAFDWLRDAGHEVPAAVESRLHDYLLRLLRRDDVPDFYTRGMSATVRAVALNALAARERITITDLRRYAGQLPNMDLFGAANYMDAALRFDGADDLVDGAVAHVLARSSTSGGKLAFNEEVDGGYNRILTTQLRSNCAVLSAFTRLDVLDRYGLEDKPAAMTRAITQTRGNRDHWENTQENMFCMNAVVDYARRFEADDPDLRVRVSLDQTLMGEGAFSSFRDAAVEFSEPITDDSPGAQAEVQIERSGTGRLYYAARLAYAPLKVNTDRVNAGITVRREYSVQRNGEWELLEEPVVQRGELVRVDLYLELPTARNFVVVDDAVPGGLEPVNRALATSSGVDAAAGDFRAAGGSYWHTHGDWTGYGISRWSFYHREIRHDAVRFYSDYLGPGRYHLSYTAQAIASGTFAAKPAHAEEMYDPDVFGKSRPLVLVVEEQD